MISRFPIGRKKETVSTPTISGGGTIESGKTGSISVYGSTSSYGNPVTYEVVTYSGISSISPISGIENGGNISFTANTVTSASTWSITVRARSSSGVLSSTSQISGSISIPLFLSLGISGTVGNYSNTVNSVGLWTILNDPAGYWTPTSGYSVLGVRNINLGSVSENLHSISGNWWLEGEEESKKSLEMSSFDISSTYRRILRFVPRNSGIIWKNVKINVTSIDGEFRITTNQYD